MGLVMAPDDTSDDPGEHRNAAEDASVSMSDQIDQSSSQVSTPTGRSQNRRLYGVERATVHFSTEPNQGLLTPDELRYLERAEQFDRDNRNSLYALLEARLEQFTSVEWPIIEDMYPEYAARVRESICLSKLDEN